MATLPIGKSAPLSVRTRAGGRESELREDDGTLAVARYVADMSTQLESMARAAKLELLAYLLAMAQSEADAIARSAQGEAGEGPR